MSYVFEAYASSQVSEGLGGSFNSSSGTLMLTNVEPNLMILITIYINTSSTNDSPSLTSQTGLTLVEKRQIAYNSEGVTFYSGVFMATASTVKLVFSIGTTVSRYGFSASQLSIS